MASGNAKAFANQVRQKNEQPKGKGARNSVGSDGSGGSGGQARNTGLPKGKGAQGKKSARQSGGNNPRQAPPQQGRPPQQPKEKKPPPGFPPVQRSDKPWFGSPYDPREDLLIEVRLTPTYR